MKAGTTWHDLLFKTTRNVSTADLEFQINLIQGCASWNHFCNWLKNKAGNLLTIKSSHGTYVLTAFTSRHDPPECWWKARAHRSATSHVTLTRSLPEVAQLTGESKQRVGLASDKRGQKFAAPGRPSDKRGQTEKRQNDTLELWSYSDNNLLFYCLDGVLL